LTTAIEQRPGAVRFAVSTTTALYQDHLRHMGYLQCGDDDRFATRWFPPSPDIRRRYEHFAASIEAMILQRAGLAPVPWEDALAEFLHRVEGSELQWWLYGSAALAVRGIAIEPRDLDLNVSDAPQAGHLLDDLLITPVERTTGWIANYTGRAFHHATIDLLAEPHEDHDDPSAPYEHGPHIASALEHVNWHGHTIAVPPLSAQLRVSEHRGLTDRTALIRAALEAGTAPE
jgi:hypothetical protein